MTVGRVSQVVFADLLPAIGTGPDPQLIAFRAGHRCPVQLDRTIVDLGGQRGRRDRGFRRSLLGPYQIRVYQDGSSRQESSRQPAAGAAQDCRNVPWMKHRFCLPNVYGALNEVGIISATGSIGPASLFWAVVEQSPNPNFPKKDELSYTLAN